MYVCICEGITDHQIEDAIASGCSTIRTLRKELNVAKDCGQCLEEIFEMIRSSKTYSTPFVNAA